VAIGQLIMTGRAHLVGIEPHDNGLMLVILRYAHEVREAEPYFERLTAEPKTEAIALAAELIERSTGAFRPDTMKDQFAAAIEELVKAKLEQRAPEIALDAKGAPPKVINIMAALKQSVQAKGRARSRRPCAIGAATKEEARAARHAHGLEREGRCIDERRKMVPIAGTNPLAREFNCPDWIGLRPPPANEGRSPPTLSKSPGYFLRGFCLLSRAATTGGKLKG